MLQVGNRLCTRMSAFVLVRGWEQRCVCCVCVCLCVCLCVSVWVRERERPITEGVSSLKGNFVLDEDYWWNSERLCVLAYERFWVCKSPSVFVCVCVCVCVWERERVEKTGWNLSWNNLTFLATTQQQKFFMRRKKTFWYQNWQTDFSPQVVNLDRGKFMKNLSTCEQSEVFYVNLFQEINKWNYINLSGKVWVVLYLGKG